MIRTRRLAPGIAVAMCLLATVASFAMSAGAFAIIAAGLLWGAVVVVRVSFSSRTRHPHRPRDVGPGITCASCGYDLRGSLQFGRCPECGTTFTSAPKRTLPSPRRIEYDQIKYIVDIASVIVLVASVVAFRLSWRMDWHMLSRAVLITASMGLLAAVCVLVRLRRSIALTHTPGRRRQRE